MGRSIHGAAAIILCVLLLTFSSIASGESVRIQSLSLDELDRIMKDPGCRCLIVVMAAWCKPCRKELPILVKLDKEYRDRGLQIIGIAVDLEGPSAMQPLVDHFKVGFPVYWVGEGAVDRYGIDKIPLTFVVKNGNIIQKFPGNRSKKYMKEKIEELLK